ncbi:MAG: hypothetical protein HOE90_07480 [Bacteriovoracaceae bacterium]|jgi:hypothetical protein|nr:hypothetical protein [Bacteriovoracaceae bacterium]
MIKSITLFALLSILSFSSFGVELTLGFDETETCFSETVSDEHIDKSSRVGTFLKVTGIRFPYKLDPNSTASTLPTRGDALRTLESGLSRDNCRPSYSEDAVNFKCVGKLVDTSTRREGTSRATLTGSKFKCQVVKTCEVSEEVFDLYHEAMEDEEEFELPFECQIF